MTDVHRQAHGNPADHVGKREGNLWTALIDALHLPGHADDHDDPAHDKALLSDELGIRTLKWAFLTLGATTLLQFAIYLVSGSVALLADTVHNLGDALNSVPLWIAFALSRRAPNRRYTYGYGRAEDLAGLAIVFSIAFSAGYILWESIRKLIHPAPLENLGWVAVAALIGFLGNEIVALLQIGVGHRIGSAAMVADGQHARTDGLTSLAVLGAVLGTWLGYPIADPLIGILIGLVIVLITLDAARAIWFRLMDAVDPALVERAVAAITEHPEVAQIRRLQMRWLGHRLQVELVLAVDNEVFSDDHATLADHIRHHLHHSLPNLGEVTVQVEEVEDGQRESAHHRLTDEQQARKPAVLVIAPCAFPLDRGTPIRIQRLATLMAHGYEIHVATFHQGRQGDYPFIIHRIPPLPFDLTRSSGASLGKLISDLFLLLLVWRLIPRYHIGLLDGHLHEGALIGLVMRLFYRTPVIYNSHGTLAAEVIASGLIKEGSWLARLLQRIEDGIERRVDLIVAQSTMRRDDFVGKGIDPERIVVVEDAPLFEDYTVESPDPELVKRHREGSEAVLIYTGELMPYQGVDLILDALPRVLERHPNVRLILFGRPIEPYLARVQADNLDGHVFLVDHEPFERLPHYFAISDIALVPRLYGRNVPGKLPIYMMGGQAIIGTNLEGINSVLTHDHTGWLIEPTVEALAEALTYLIENPAVRQRLGRAALEEARRRYAPQIVEHAMNQAYTSLLGTPNDR